MLTWALHDLADNRLGWLDEYDRDQVTVPLDARRFGQVSIPIDSKLTKLIRPLSTVLRAWYYGVPVLAGPIHLPRWLPDEDRVELNAMDPGFRLERSYLNQRADAAFFAYQAAIDQSEILARLIDHVRPTAAELRAGVWDVPIIRGSLPATKARDRGYENGDQVWALIENLSEVIEGVDYELEPIQPGTKVNTLAAGENATGALCKLNTYTRQGSYKGDDVVFTSGRGWEDCTFTYEPAGDGVANRSTWQGQTEEGVMPERYTSESPESLLRYGIYGRYTGAADISVLQTLKEHAQAQASAESFPVDYFDVVPAVEGTGYEFDPETGAYQVIEGRSFGVPPKFGPPALAGAKYWVGDTVGLDAYEPPSIDGKFTGRVTDAVLAGQENGDTVVALTLGPDIPAVAVT